MNVHTQLGAIYTRLQEVVEVAAATVAAVAKKEEKHLKDNKQKEEEKIAKHIHEYQRLLQKQHEQSTKSQTDIVNQRESQSQAAQAAAVSAAVQAASAEFAQATAAAAAIRSMWWTVCKRTITQPQ